MQFFSVIENLQSILSKRCNLESKLHIMYIDVDSSIYGYQLGSKATWLPDLFWTYVHT